MAVIGIVVFCGAIVGAAAWLLNRPPRPKDPREDEEQMNILVYVPQMKRIGCLR